MANIKHSELPKVNNHGVITWEYADEAARLAAVGFAAIDQYKAAYQLSDKTLWVLTGHSPIAWEPMATAAIGSSEVVYVLDTDINQPGFGIILLETVATIVGYTPTVEGWVKATDTGDYHYIDVNLNINDLPWGGESKNWNMEASMYVAGSNGETVLEIIGSGKPIIRFPIDGSIVNSRYTIKGRTGELALNGYSTTVYCEAMSAQMEDRYWAGIGASIAASQDFIANVNSVGSYWHCVAPWEIAPHQYDFGYNANLMQRDSSKNLFFTSEERTKLVSVGNYIVLPAPNTSPRSISFTDTYTGLLQVLVPGVGDVWPLEFFTMAVYAQAIVDAGGLGSIHQWFVIEGPIGSDYGIPVNDCLISGLTGNPISDTTFTSTKTRHLINCDETGVLRIY